ncbi:TolC family protein [Fodinibius sediminis]|jgi:cobalt-zinc-cadmium efflux system outer membrane protein|uniref:Outer membrane protein, cobalt-zinc-cadmium efflux system n=1 Tax=Fodinibius sediminis TaxID=1214077 RepID=A0A521EF07_9BACT|nr:TolC family protein [Fodinibius sediminis]SMO82494.1 outer membrane protein, cobalt-zinc-cadmium efflux system [Fodinibius sediminis]
MKLFLKTVLVLGMLVLAAGCASEQTLIEPPSESTLGDQNYGQSPALNKNVAPQDTASTVTISDTLTFSDALSKALLENPRLQSYGWQVRAKEAERLQASLLPNPRLQAEMENVGGSGPFEGLDNREITIRLGQKILLGADRLKAKRLAGYNRQLAGWDYETQRLDVLTGVTQAYISALEAQQQWNQQQALVTLAEELFHSISAQVDAGKVSPIAATRAKVELSRVRIDLKNARSTFETARSNLASFWGNKQPAFEGLAGTLAKTDSLPAYSSLAQYISRNPDVARWATEMQQRESRLALERAKGIPDPTISGGYKRFEDVGAEAAVVGISIPLPLFDRNQGDIKAAKYQIWRGRSQRQAAVTEVTRALQEAYNRLQASYQELQQLQEEVLPGAQSAFKGIQSGYRQGKFDYLEVLDAQRTLFTSRTRYIQALAEYNRAVAEIERLIGTPLSDIPSN